MIRAFCLGLLLFGLTACATPVERLPLKPLPEEDQALPFAELLTRARLQAGRATEAFYSDKWTDIEEAARGLERTAKFLGLASEVPEKLKNKLPVLASDLGKDAAEMGKAAKAQDATKTNEVQQRLNLKVRELGKDG
jgi:hypothetical protein